MNTFITGGCGFLGSNIAAHLLKDGQKVTVFDNLERAGASENLTWLRQLGSLEFIRGDVRNASEISDGIREARPDAVFHLAGQVSMIKSLADPRTDFETNVTGSLNVLEAVNRFAREAAVVYSSSNKVYGDLSFLNLREESLRYSPSHYQDGVDESAPLAFHTPYGCSKGAADQYMLDYSRSFGLQTVVFRHSTIYGGRQFATIDQGWVGWFVRQALEVADGTALEPFTISGNGKQVRDLLHVSDAVSCYLSAVSCIEAANGQAFNIGGGIENSMSLLELFALLEERLGIRMTYTQLEWRQDDQRFFVSNNAKAHDILRWTPSMDKARGVEDAISWGRETRRLTLLTPPSK